MRSFHHARLGRPGRWSIDDDRHGGGTTTNDDDDEEGCYQQPHRGIGQRISFLGSIASEHTPLLQLADEPDGTTSDNPPYSKGVRCWRRRFPRTDGVEAPSEFRVAPPFRTAFLAVFMIGVLAALVVPFVGTSRLETDAQDESGPPSSLMWFGATPRGAYDRQFDLWEAWKDQDLLRLAKVHRDRGQGDENESSDAGSSEGAVAADDDDTTTFHKALNWFRDAWGSVVDRSRSWWGRAEDTERGAWNATAQSAHRTWNGVHDASGQAGQRAKDWWDGATSSDGERRAWNATVETTHRAWDGIEAGTDAARQRTEQWWEGADLGTRERDAWNATEEEAQRAWTGLREDSGRMKDGTETWWNETVHNEREWQQVAGRHLRTFGRTVRSWWNATAAATQSKGRVLEHNFVSWWHRAGQKEHQWWNDTVDAFGRFGERTRDETTLWWNWTRQGVGRGWQATEQAEEEWWNATRDWFATHASANRTRSSALGQQHDLRDLVYFNSTRAFQMLTGPYGWIDQSSHFFFYQQGWDSQINQAYCGVASSAAVLNSLKAAPQLPHLPSDPTYEPYEFATQQALVQNACVIKHVSRSEEGFDGVLSFPGGLSLDQVGRLLECFLDPTLWNVTVVHVDQSVSFDSMTVDLVRALHDPNSRVIVNIHRAEMGQQGGGHFSPLAAYYPQDRMFLFMDVAKYKYPPVWVPAEALYAALQTEDRCGTWNFPAKRSQVGMLTNITNAYYRSNATTPEEKENLMTVTSDALDCRTEYRGYIIVQQKK